LVRSAAAEVVEAGAEMVEAGAASSAGSTGLLAGWAGGSARSDAASLGAFPDLGADPMFQVRL
jgi:hypothetical protein